MLSQLFAGDDVLQQVADDVNRISKTQNPNGPWTERVQLALLIWDPASLPGAGADGQYGDETANAVVRFKRDVLLVPEAEIINDVGPRTVKRLDAIAFADEQRVTRGMAVVLPPGAGDDLREFVRATVDFAGGAVSLVIGDRLAVVEGDDAQLASIGAALAEFVSAIVDAATPVLPAGLDEEAGATLSTWLASVDPTFIADSIGDWAEPEPFELLAGCVRE